jgi:hypothetical protein
MWVLMIICCLCAYEQRRPLALNNFNIGHADTAAYALQGRSLAREGTFEINYISNFYHAYNTNIKRHDDHWPPFQGLLYGVAFKLFGVDASIARQAALFMGAVFFPLTCAWLLFGLTGRHWPCLIAVLIYISDIYFLKESFRLLADVSLCTLVLAYAASILTSKRHHPAWLLIAGIFGGLAWTCKGSQIFLLPLLPLASFCLHGKIIFRKSWLYFGMLAFFVILTPRLIDNWNDHGKAFHSTQNHVASFFGLKNSPWENWDENFYGVYWDDDLPHMSERFESWPIYRDSIIGNLRVTLGSIILGPGKSTRMDRSINEWIKMGWLSASLGEILIEKPKAAKIGANGKIKEDSRLALVTNPSSWPTQYRSLLQIFGALWAFTVFLTLPFYYILIKLKKYKSSIPLNLKIAFVIALLIIAEASFVIIFWYAMPRLVLPIVPLSLLLCLSILVKLLDKSSKGLKFLWIKLFQGKNFYTFFIDPRHSKKITKAFNSACLLIWVPIGYYIIHSPVISQKALLKNSGIKTWDTPHYPHYHRVAQALSKEVPKDAIVMTRNPWELLFYSPDSMKAVGLPHAEPRIIIAIAKYYGVTHLIYDRHRAGLKDYLNSGHPGIKRIMNSPSPMYALNYSKFKDGEIADLEELKGYAKKIR